MEWEVGSGKRITRRNCSRRLHHERSSSTRALPSIDVRPSLDGPPSITKNDPPPRRGGGVGVECSRAWGHPSNSMPCMLLGHLDQARPPVAVNACSRLSARAYCSSVLGMCAAPHNSRKPGQRKRASYCIPIIFILLPMLPVHCR